MADGVDIDLYANIEDDFNQDTEFGSHGDDLYDDVITASASGDGLESNNHTQKPPSATISVSSIPANYTGKKYNLYVGNLTWWTTDQDLTDALTTIGVHDLLEIKFFENRANGQSKGFALVIVGSDSSSRAIFDKLSRKEIHGQVPQVTPYSRHALNQLEAASRKGGEGPPQTNNNRSFQNRQEHFGDKSPRGSRPPPPNNPGKPHFQPRGMPRGPPISNQGPPPQGPPSGPPPGYAPVRPGGPPPGIPPPGSMPPGNPQMRGPPPGMPRMGPGPPPPLRGPPGMQDPRRPPPVRPEWNQRLPAPFHNAGPPPPQPVPPPGLRPPMSGPPQMPPVTGGPPPGPMPHPGGPPTTAPHVNPAFFPPPHTRAPPPGPVVTLQPGDPYGRPPPTAYPPSDPYGRPAERHEPPPPALSEQEFEEIFQRNKTVSSSAINRAVQDASAADFASAIETLVTAISLIKQSKIAGDDRCKILISSLQDTLHGIEEKSYGSKSASTSRRSRSRSRERDREREKRSRHRSRSRERDYERNRERERHYEERHRSDRGERSERERERERTEREYASSSSSSRRH
ncbi:cleavage and polyadenylation specificity factor subunit 6-like isoform X2 [Gigantopelta aegis]|uniref:cleavage and polyadenylation specificity factor subunit 6-like isoform X2 n=1 Tax=Gigantopelta aegis TaxID=1735272 RepID=UPI001B88BCC2|nr:cleavage and polyadenylation specificity factor subunit 6-like isoform X2 [Gigantopelta aegis]